MIISIFKKTVVVLGRVCALWRVAWLNHGVQYLSVRALKHMFTRVMPWVMSGNWGSSSVACLKNDSSLYGDVASCLAHRHCHHRLHCHHGHHDLWVLHHIVIVIVIIMSGHYITFIFKQYRIQLSYLKTWHLQDRMSCGLDFISATRFVPFLMLLGLHFFPGKLRLGAIDDPSPERAGPSGGVKNIHLPIDWKYVWGGGQFCILPLWQQTMHGVGLNEQMGCRLGQLGFLWSFFVAYLGNNCALVTWSYFFLRESSLDSHSSLPPVSDFFPIKL